MDEYYYATGENVDGDLITLESEDDYFINHYFNKINISSNFLKIFLVYCQHVLKENDGGHLDIFNENDNYITDIEV